MAKTTLKDEVNFIINELESNPNYQKEVFPDGTFYVVDKNEYSFHTYFVYDMTQINSKRANKNMNSTATPIVDDITYNLKDRTYSIFRNFKKVNFSEDNLVRSFGRISAEKLSFLEVPENEGFYQKCFNKIAKLNSEREKMVSRFLIRLIEEFPVLERVHKAGFDINKVFGDIREYKTNSLLEAFGLETKLHLKTYREFNSDEILRKSSYSSDVVLPIGCLRRSTVDEVQQLRSIRELCRELDKKYGLNKTREVLDLVISSYTAIKDCTLFKFVDEVKKSLGSDKKSVDLKRLIEYCAYECDVRQGITFVKGAISTYRDYVTMASRLGNHFERYPKSLKLRHDVAAKYYNLLNDQTNTESFTKNVQAISHLEGNISKTGWAIVVPKTPEDVVDEGEQLSHCVKSYIQSIAKGDCNIVFLRKADKLEEAVYTVELRENAIVQFAGFQNCLPEDEAKEAVHKWAESFNLVENYE